MPAKHNHQYWMARALQLARRGLYSTAPNPRVGCVVVKHGECLSEGWHEYSGGAHAEVNAIKQARAEIPPGCDFYVSLEPCSHQGKTPACADALIERQPARVIIATQDPNPQVAGKGIARLKAANIEVVTGVLESQARGLNCGFISRFERQRPFLRLKMASTIDGRTALQSGDSQWITGAQARQDVQFLRARSCAILTTAATVLSDDPMLNLRLTSAELAQTREVRQPVRVVLDSELRLSGSEKLFQQGGAVWIYTCNTDANKHETLRAAGAHLTVFDNRDGIDLADLMQHLATRDINELHSECGQTLAGALLQQGLVDELVIYMSAKILGSQARGAFDIGLLTEMNSSLNFKIKQLRSIGDDIRFTLTPEQN